MTYGKRQDNKKEDVQMPEGYNMTMKRAMEIALELARNNQITKEMVRVEPRLENEYVRQEEAFKMMEHFISLIWKDKYVFVCDLRWRRSTYFCG